MNHRSLAFRLSVWFAAMLSVTFALVGTAMMYGLQGYLRSNLRDVLMRRSEQVEQIVRQAATVDGGKEIAAAIDTRIAPEINNRFVRVSRFPAVLVYRSGQPADHSFNSDAIDALRAWPDKASLRRSVSSPSSRVTINATPIATPSGRYLVEVGASSEQIETVQSHALILLCVLIPALVGCAGAGGYLLVNWALRPVEKMSQTAERISIQDLDSRIPVLPTGDALERLSISLNHMLSRLHDSVQTSRRFLTDASHELRTPLTVIKGELEEISVKGPCDASSRERIGSVLEEVGRLERLVAGLLVLSRLDAGEAQREWVDVNLSELASTTADQMRLVADDGGVELRQVSSGLVVVRGDRGRLKQVIVNLLANAIKFTPSGGVVTLDTQQNREGFPVLEVRDTGVGIPPSALPHVFDRFFRADEARSRDEGGDGLGLSIVKSICTAHDATVEVDSSPGQGSCFRLIFPRTNRVG